MQLPDRCISIEGGCSDAALRPLIFSFFLSFLGIYILWTHAQCLLDTCGL
jgi:hypothetical protein